MNHEPQRILEEGRSIEIQSEARGFPKELGEGAQGAGGKTKVCVKCSQRLTMSSFHLHSSSCKPCKRESDRGRIRGDYNPRNNITSAARARKRRWAASNSIDPMKAKARRAVRNAVKSGQLTRAAACQSCGSHKLRSDGKAAIQGHHHKGYEFPLDVKWLCPSCHKKEDAAIAQKEVK